MTVFKKDFSKFRAVYVTGSQFGGTEEVARAIAEDTGYRLITQDDIGWANINRQSLTTLFAALKKTGVVIESPATAHMCQDFAADDVAIVYVYRDPKEVTALQRAAGWKFIASELRKYGVRDPRGQNVASVKYERWKSQKKGITNAIEVKYTDLPKAKEPEESDGD